MKAKRPKESRRGGLWLGLSLLVAFFCLFQALPPWSPTDALQPARSQHAVAPSSFDTNIASDYRVGAENYTYYNIEDIRAGQLVLAANPATGQLEPRRVLQTFRRTTYHLRHLTFQSHTGARQTFETTDEHPFWSHGAARWIPAGDLEPGDRVIDPHGAQSLLIATHREPHPEGVTVFNFEVEGFNSYFVAAKGPGGQPVLVHNYGNNAPKVTGKHSRRLGDDLIAKGYPRPPGHDAGHIVPTNVFGSRSARVQKAITTAHAKFNKHLGENLRDTAINGFWAEAGHAGTHTDKFLLELGKAFRGVNSKKSAEAALESLWKRIEAGEFIP